MLRISDSNNRKICLFMLIAILLLPKINLISISGSNTGIRIDDILILLYCLYYIFCGEFLKLKIYRSKTFFYTSIIFFLFSILSIFSGLFVGTLTRSFIAVLALLRKFEYFIFVFIGVSYVSHGGSYKEVRRVLDIVFLLLGVIAVFQILGIIGSFNGGVYDYRFGSRCSATFNGAYEYAAYLNIMLPFYLYDISKYKSIKSIKIKNIFYYVFCAILMLFTESRTSLIVFVLITIYFVVFKFKQSVRGTSLIIIIFAIVFLMLNFNSISIFRRFYSLNISQMFKDLVYLWEHRDFDAFMKNWNYIYDYAIKTTDPSFTIRLSKWFDCIDGMLRSPLFGYGLNVYPTLDGNWVKIFCENGLLGLIIFIFLCKAILDLFKRYPDKELSYPLRVAFFGLLLGAIFIDILESSKVMELFWFYVGIIAGIIELNYRNKVVNLKHSKLRLIKQNC